MSRQVGENLLESKTSWTPDPDLDQRSWAGSLCQLWRLQKLPVQLTGNPEAEALALDSIPPAFSLAM